VCSLLWGRGGRKGVDLFLVGYVDSSVRMLRFTRTGLAGRKAGSDFIAHQLYRVLSEFVGYFVHQYMTINRPLYQQFCWRTRSLASGSLATVSICISLCSRRLKLTAPHIKTV
jgi:hypothetical protein